MLGWNWLFLQRLDLMVAEVKVIEHRQLVEQLFLAEISAPFHLYVLVICMWIDTERGSDQKVCAHHLCGMNPESHLKNFGMEEVV